MIGLGCWRRERRGNHRVQLSHKVSRVLFGKNGWICSLMARKTETALILIAILLAAVTVSGFSRFLKPLGPAQSREGICFEVELPAHNPV